MGGRKITITVADEQYAALAQMARSRGLPRVATLTKSVVVQFVQNEIEPSENKKTVLVPVTNYRELADYVDCKKFGSVESFATFAMAQYMTKYPAKTREKAETEN